MKIKVANHAGFCFGVRRAVEAVEKELSIGDTIYSLGPMIHNPQFVAEKEKQGLRVVETVAEIPKGSKVLIRAHGLTLEELQSLHDREARLVDLTCPVLLNIYDKIDQKRREGYDIVIVGDRYHPEVLAMASRCGDRIHIVSTEQEAREISGVQRIYVISQTTNRREYYENIVAALDPSLEILVEDTICNATTVRQRECEELAQESDVMIVIGGKNSSNSKKLYEIAKKHCKNSFFIERIDDLTLQSAVKFNTIGVTAGASTPDWIIEEVVKVMDNYTNEEYMEQVEGSMIKIYPKDIVKGKVIYVTDTEVMVNINYRADGIIKLDELSNDETMKPKDLFEEGQEIDVYVIKLDDGDGNVVLSTRRVEGLKNWQNLVDKFEANEVVEAAITGDNKGGLVCTVMGINGFIPASQITTYYVRDLKQYIGKTMECKIISLDDKKRRLVLSRRVIEEEALDKVWDTIEVDKVIKGVVARLTDFGAFVNLGGVDGLVHISDISWQRIKHPSDELTVGEEVDVLVLRANREKNRISLGLKQLTKKPFELFLENNNEGEVVKGTVVNLLDFGAFVRLKEGVEGLVHVSQISHEHVEKPSDEMNIGDEIDVKILEINREEQRIALSIKALLPEPERKERPQRSAPRQRNDNFQRDRENRNASFENQELNTSLGALLDEAILDAEMEDQE